MAPSRKFLVSKTFKDRREEEGVSRFFVGIDLFQSTEILQRGTLLCLKSFGHPKYSCIRGEYHGFPSKTSCVSTESFLRETPLCFFKKSRMENFMDKTKLRTEYHVFFSKQFCLTVSKTFVGEPFSVSLVPDLEKVYAQKGFLSETFFTHH